MMIPRNGWQIKFTDATIVVDNNEPPVFDGEDTPDGRDGRFYQIH